MIDHLTGVVVVDDGLLVYRSVVAAAIGINDRAAHNLQIGLVE